MAEKIKKGLKSLFTDSEWDYDVSKITGIAIIIFGCVLAWKEKESAVAVIGFGAGLLGCKALAEGV